MDYYNFVAVSFHTKKTVVFGLPHSEDRMIIFIRLCTIQARNLRTDRWICRISRRYVLSRIKNKTSFKCYNAVVKHLVTMTQTHQGLRVFNYVQYVTFSAGLHLSVENVSGVIFMEHNVE